MVGLRGACPFAVAALMLSFALFQLGACPADAESSLQSSIELPGDQANLTYHGGIPSVRAGKGLTFMANASSPFFNITYQWDFGDGSFSAERSPLHIYRQAGTYNVTLTVSDGVSVTNSTLLVRIDPRTAPRVSGGGLPDMLLVALPLLVLMMVSFVLAGTEMGLWLLSPIFIFLYSKLHPDHILDNYTRGQIHGYILANPGEHYNSIKNALKLKNGNLAYHLRRLEKENVVKWRIDGIYKRFYPFDMRVPEPDPLVLTEAQKLVLTKILQNPGISQNDIASQLSLNKSTVKYHVDRLLAKGLICRERVGMRYRCHLARTLPEDAMPGLSAGRAPAGQGP